MKKSHFLVVILLIMMPFIGNSQQVDSSKKASSEVFSVGENFKINNPLSEKELQLRYAGLKEGDTINVQFKANVDAVCKEKGCWMKVFLEDGKEIMVKFKDYGFFVPKDIENSTAWINGKAYVTEMSVEEQQHYAEDAGKTKAEIDKITQPLVTLSFLADGVKIQK